MAHHRLVVNSTPYVLRSAQDRTDVRAAIIVAVRAGGDFVHIPGDALETDVLITPATDARIELVETRAVLRPASVDLDLDWVEFGRV